MALQNLSLPIPVFSLPCTRGMDTLRDDRMVYTITKESKKS